MKRLGVSLLHPGWYARLSQGIQHKVTRGVTSLPGASLSGWDVSLSQGTQHNATGSITSPLGQDAFACNSVLHPAFCLVYLMVAQVE